MVILSRSSCWSSGWYCVGCEAYKDDSEMEGDHVCPTHKMRCIEREEENYFFALSKYQSQIQVMLGVRPPVASNFADRLLLALLFCVEEGSGLALAHDCAGHKLWESLELEAQSPRRELQV